MVTSTQINNLIHLSRRIEAEWDQADFPAGLSAGEARLLATIASREGQTARDVGEALGLDAGYISRILADFQKRGWLTRAPARHDRRAKTLKLSAEGWVLALALDELAERQTKQLVRSLPPGSEALLTGAVQTVNQLLGATPAAPLIFRQLQLGDAGWIIYRHATVIAPECGWDNRFEGMCARILADFIAHYDASCERSWVVERGGSILGSIFLVRKDAETAQLRLLYVEPAARGMGIANKLLDKSIRFARDKGYKTLRLYTTSNLVVARRQYAKLGFTMVREEPGALFGTQVTGEYWELAL